MYLWFVLCSSSRVMKHNVIILHFKNRKLKNNKIFLSFSFLALTYSFLLSIKSIHQTYGCQEDNYPSLWREKLNGKFLLSISFLKVDKYLG